MGLDAVLGEPGVHTQLVAHVGDGLEDADDEAVVGLGGAHLPDLAHAIGGGLLIRIGDGQAGRGAHPVQGLVGAAVEWTRTEPSALSMSTRVARGRWASRRPE